LAIARLDEAFAALPGIGFATQLDVSAEQFTWGGRAVQGLALGMRGGQEGWRVEQLALRAPGSARVAAQGRANATSPVGFDGALTLEAADAALLWAWLSGQPDSAAARTRPLRATSELTVAPGRIALRQLKAESAPLALTGAATFDRTRNERQAAFSLTAPALEPLAGLLAPHAPELAARLAALAPHDGVATLDATLDAGATVGRGDDTPVVQVTLRAPGLGIEASLAAPAAALAQAPDVALMGVPLTWRAQATTARAASLIAALGLQGIVAGDAGTGVVTADGTTTLAEALRAPVPLRVLLVTPTADVTLAGQWDARGRGGFAPGALDVRTADLAPLFGLDVEATMPVSGRAVLARTPDRISLTGIDARLLGSSVRGQLEITSGEPPQVTGTLEADRLDAGAMLALLTGAHAKAAPDPLARGVAGRWRGRIGVSAPEATLFAGTSARALAFTLQGTAQGVDVDALTASMGEGALAGRLHLQRTDDGLALDAEATLRNANAGALRHHALALAGGRADVRLSIAGKGRSHAALLGALNGEGQVSLRDARLAGLGPRAVAVVEQAVDVRPAPDAARVRSALDRALAEGALAVAAAEIPFTVRDGRVRAGRTVLAGDGAALSVSGGYDLAAGGVDAHATLSLTPSAEHAGRPPEVVLTWRGTALAPVRTLDVAATMNWIALRAVERETRRLDALERESRVPAAPNPSVPPVVVPAPEIIAPEPPAPSGVSVPAFNAEQLMPLPPPIDVRPAPGTKKRAPTAAPALPPARPPLSLTPAPPPS
jgi:large subunit ribosomal protein L24